jgi:hypothetical protein
MAALFDDLTAALPALVSEPFGFAGTRTRP